MEAVTFYLRFTLLALWITVATLLFLPMALLMWGSPFPAWLYARALSQPALLALGVRLDVDGREILARERPAIIIANHQSNLDIVTLGAVYPRATVVIGKKELRKIPVFNLLFKATGQILLDRGDRAKAVAGLDKAVEALRRRGRNIWVFPEGTRSKGGGLGTFKKGAFHMAVAAQVPIVPVVSQSLERVVDLKRRRLPGGRLRVRILEPIRTAGLGSGDVAQLAERAEALFRETLDAMQVRPVGA